MRRGQEGGQLQAPRLALQPPTLLGRAVPDPARRRGTARSEAVDESELPVLLPDLDDFKPSGRPEPPLGKATDWVNYSETYRRETNTMPQWAGSCWYYLRYIDPKNDRAAVVARAGEVLAAGRPLRRRGRARGLAPALQPVLAQGPVRSGPGSARPEPFQKLVNQGMILGEMEYTGYQRQASGSDWRRPTDVYGGGSNVYLSRRRTFAGRSSNVRVKLARTLSRRIVRRGGIRPRNGRPVDPDRRPRPQDVQESRQRHQPRRGRLENTGPTASASTRCSWGRSKP